MDERAFETLRNEMMLLAQTMRRFRVELAAIRHPDAPEDRFTTMADQMDAIVKGTEESAEAILLAAEGIADLVSRHRASLSKIEGEDVAAGLDDHVASIFEACAFQDLTGQRTAKVVESLKFVDQRVDSLIRLWGEDRLSRAPVPGKGAAVRKPPGEQLDGPALRGRGVSQDDVDRMFADNESAPPTDGESLFDDEAPDKTPETDRDAAAKSKKEKAGQKDIDKLFEEEGREVSQDDIDKLFD